MTGILVDLRQTLFPPRGSKDGPLPPLLVGLTLVTGLVDAFSYLVLGHVFVANMTGNVVFLGFALAGAPGFSIGASCAAIVLFVLGALVGGRLGHLVRSNRGRLLGSATGLQAVLVGVSLVLAANNGAPVAAGTRYGLISVLAAAMGLQNAAVRQLAVPELTTTVLTMTLTGIAADGSLAGGSGSRAGRRLVAIAAMFLGALAGAICVLHVRIEAPLAVALAVLVSVTGAILALGRHDPRWSQWG